MAHMSSEDVFFFAPLETFLDLFVVFATVRTVLTCVAVFTKPLAGGGLSRLALLVSSFCSRQNCGIGPSI
jgi:hypothetical protein